MCIKIYVLLRLLNSIDWMLMTYLLNQCFSTFLNLRIRKSNIPQPPKKNQNDCGKKWWGGGSHRGGGMFDFQEHILKKVENPVLEDLSLRSNQYSGFITKASTKLS